MTMPACWAVLVAAGAGRRMTADRPKQYLPLAGKLVIEHSLQRLLEAEAVRGLVVVLAADDAYWPVLQFNTDKPLWTMAGGRERADSVLAGLDRLAEQAAEEDWVLVHDAARPCLAAADLQKLIDTLHGDACGGLLAAACRDTLKQAGDGQCLRTLDRSRIWQAQTPQMFRLGLLRKALQQARREGVAVTDEAMAMEQAGYRPRLVEAAMQNLKITTPADLPLAEFILRQRAEGTDA